MLSERARKMIVDFESLGQPSKWPGGASGVTIGFGYDLGYVTMDQFEADWGPLLPAAALAQLRKAIGKRGPAARALAPSYAGVRIPRAAAERVFTDRTVPLSELRTRQAFPGVEHLPADAYGALVSLVLNRGASLVDPPGKDRRREMRAIRDLVPRGDLAGIAREIRSMKRLWVGQGLGGLLHRRDAEAALVESCIAPVG